MHWGTVLVTVDLAIHIITYILIIATPTTDNSHLIATSFLSQWIAVQEMSAVVTY